MLPELYNMNILGEKKSKNQLQNLPNAAKKGWGRFLFSLKGNFFMCRLKHSITPVFFFCFLQNWCN